MGSLLRQLLIFGLTIGAASLVWRAAKQERNAGRRAPSTSSQEHTLDALSDEEQEMLLKELASQL